MGLIAGLADTVAVTASQLIEMQVTGRGQSDVPMKAAGKVFGVEARGKAAFKVEKQKEESSAKGMMIQKAHLMRLL